MMCSTSLIVPVRLFAGIACALAMLVFSVLVKAVIPINCRNLRRPVWLIKYLLFQEWRGFEEAGRQLGLADAYPASYETREIPSHPDDATRMTPR